jgi:UDP-GlcNAc:undecaprenyl-phosphate GlcNAc-1-phosphate transferase
MVNAPAEPTLAWPALAAVAAAAFGLVVALTPLARRLSVRWGAIDEPGEARRVHSSPTPTSGGLVILLGFLAPFLIAAAAGGALRAQVVGIAVGCVLMSLMGAVDDRRGLPVTPRLAVQIGVACLVMAFGVRITGLRVPFDAAGYVNLGLLSAPVTLVWILLVTNAINWIDGLDGLAAGICAIASGALAAMAGANLGATGAVLSGLMGAALCGACLGFLPHNFNPAKIFMGDAGAMFLGFALACASIVGAFKVPTAIAVFAPLLILGVPIADVVATVASRAKNGRPIYRPDKSHLHHRLLQAGLSVRQAVLLLYGAEVALCALAFLLLRV